MILQPGGEGSGLRVTGASGTGCDRADRRVSVKPWAGVAGAPRLVRHEGVHLPGIKMGRFPHNL